MTLILSCDAMFVLPCRPPRQPALEKPGTTGHDVRPRHRRSSGNGRAGGWWISIGLMMTAEWALVKNNWSEVGAEALWEPGSHHTELHIEPATTQTQLTERNVLWIQLAQPVFYKLLSGHMMNGFFCSKWKKKGTRSRNQCNAIIDPKINHIHKVYHVVFNLLLVKLRSWNYDLFKK